MDLQKGDLVLYKDRYEAVVMQVNPDGTVDIITLLNDDPYHVSSKEVTPYTVKYLDITDFRRKNRIGWRSWQAYRCNLGLNDDIL